MGQKMPFQNYDKYQSIYVERDIFVIEYLKFLSQWTKSVVNIIFRLGNLFTILYHNWM